MSDLQCAATLVVVDTAAAGEALRARRAAAVVSTPGALDTAADLAQRLEVARRDLPEDATSPEILVRALDDLADEYRGECVAVVVTAEALAALARLVLPGGGGALVVEIDGDGHRWGPWAAGGR
ncbi:hypothetical protein [Oceanitalea stevensii]|uniref:Uncharacterized protein n=1 Tax=Oceanitalea stevensii TaxID=2763072 RepID=A0ABR8Z2R6_9MICO|nr:hypothetical protein [Oceanitalea stevensii]MBD8062635.1 hypothetical protein [Oceanitalea stevensii]